MPSQQAVQLSRATAPSTTTITVQNERGESASHTIAAERPLTIYVNKREVVTLMTLGCQPEALVIGYLLNQRIIAQLADLQSVQVDWEVEAASVVTRDTGSVRFDHLERRTVTSGCGQGTLFGDLVSELEHQSITPLRLSQQELRNLLAQLAHENQIYRAAGGVHACALCDRDRPLFTIEDIGRHNAVDTITGLMHLEGIDGSDKCFYTTGRLTSEMVIKAAQMKTPLLVSRSGITQLGFELAKKLGLTLIGRAKGEHFLIYCGAEYLALEAELTRHG